VGRIRLFCAIAVAPCIVFTAAVASDAQPALHAAKIHPREGRYHGDTGYPVKFKVSGGFVRSFRMEADTCGVYKKKKIALNGHKFEARMGPAGRHLHVYGTWTSNTKVDLAWNVGYEEPSQPSCLSHDTWKVSWRSAS
jgi:hypothetical protein